MRVGNWWKPMSDLARLSKPFSAAHVEKAPKGKYGDYVPHATVVQALLATVGPFDLEVVQILRGDMPARLDKETGEVKKDPLHNVVVGAVIRLTVEIDGRTTRIEEAGDCEDPHNWATDGARLKDCLSDGIKRAAARVGLGLSLWVKSPDQYFLYDYLSKREVGGSDGAVPGAGTAPSPVEQRPTGIVQELIDTYDYQTLQKICDAHGVKRLADLSPKELEAAKAELDAGSNAQ